MTDATGKPTLSVHGLSVFYGQAQVLFDLSFEVARGEVVALMGRNGAGKSTMLKAIMGLLDSVQGSINFDGHELRGLPPFRIARLGMGYVPEERRIFTDLTVRENLAVKRPTSHRAEALDASSAWTLDRIITLFPPLAVLMERQAGLLSGGEQQMLTVARTLCGNPTFLLLDEPSEGVAPIIVEKMAEVVQTLKQQGVSVLLSEQNIHFAEMIADRAIVLERGMITFESSMQDLLDSPEVQRQAFLI